MTIRLRKPRAVIDETVYTRNPRRTLAPAVRRCDDCQWPDRCRDDRICWTAEKQLMAAERLYDRKGRNV